MRKAEKERLKEGETADEEQKKLKKEVKKKSSSTAKNGPTKSSSTKKKASGSDEDQTSPVMSQVDGKEEADEEIDDDVQWQADTSLEAARQRIQEQLNSVTADMVMLSTSEPEKKIETANKENPKIENGSSTHERLVKEVKANLKEGVAANQFRSILGSLSGYPPQEEMTAVFEALFAGVDKGFAKEVSKKKSYLAATVAQAEGSQLLLLRAIEAFSVKTSAAALKEVALILKTLYDADLLEEEYIGQWYQEGLKGGNRDSVIWKNAKPFIEWLQNAESESEEE